MQSDIDPRTLIGRKAYDRDGAKIGTVDEVYLDDATGEPEWAAVRTGLFGRDAFVPLEPSEVVDESLRIPYDRTLIRTAPDLGVGRHLSPEQELRLYHHYRMPLPTPETPAPGAGERDERDEREGAGHEPRRPADPGRKPGGSRTSRQDPGHSA
ncbi:PRC-barrel domain-containing protein [Streptomyces mobaraensis]|uniref:PRC-barrel domain containing protein n=1 Tax=Streptomyces mobaraensis TaxID=35621 RepID=A0A5N5W3U3_STRMB|nr:PRC-barrel domain-containing protein [Streptomyces mobaraensis]KAB7836830.1 PRC-barrel domain containing protein [Streptomyces mobaraensis]